MLHWKNFIRETYYDVLSVKEDASYEEIRASYRSAILNYHPDKLQNTHHTSDLKNESDDRFLKVQKAWEILGNSMSRGVYDSKVRALRQDTEVSEDISLEEMMIEDNGEILEMFYQCRCGDYFSIDSSEFEKMGYTLSRDDCKISIETPDALPASVVLPCGSCSLQVRLLINTDIKLPIDGVRNVSSSNPETLMAEIDAAITKLEYSRATALLDSPSPTTQIVKTSMSSDSGENPQYDAKIADGAYRAGCAALAAGKLDEALQYLNVSLSKCPPDKTSAVAKLQSLISLTSQQLQKFPT
ncbi:unnamed protein product [Dovyalis caffra]|uniref:DPH4 homolog n=1 Tax=Dovyalis caffra TaxID=77055 RepID=A0AAV1SBF9_9ROSI|nr:unnamed protein product [Dovyalis caffra]